MDEEDTRELAATVRRACIEILLDSHEDAGIRGLCGEGRFEAAVDALRSTPLDELMARVRSR